MGARALLEALRASAPDSDELARRVLALARARSSGDHAAGERAFRSLSESLSRLRAAGELAGSVAVLLEVSGPRPDRFAAAVEASTRGVLTYASVVPTPFEEALTDLAEREPTVAASLEDAAERVRRTYAGYVDPRTGEWVYPHGFALARTIDLTIVGKVKDEVRKAVAGGKTVAEAVDVVAALGDWSRAYAETVVRTNVTTAFSAGRFREAEALEARGVEVGFRLETAGDSDVRKNHAAADGLTASVDDPIWDRLSPPLGLNCFLPETLVSGSFEGALAARWSGDAVRLATVGGHELAVTPGHPVATPTGFVAAGRLRVGDSVLVPTRPPSDSIEVDALWAGLAAASTPRDVQLAPRDLHGDAARVVGATGLSTPCDLEVGWSKAYERHHRTWLDGGRRFVRGLSDAKLVVPVDLASVERRRHDDWVYDVQSPVGWLLAGGVVVSNCRCVLVPIVGGRIPPSPVRVPPGARADSLGFGGRPDRR